VSGADALQAPPAPRGDPRAALLPPADFPLAEEFFVRAKAFSERIASKATPRPRIPLPELAVERRAADPCTA